MNADMVSDCGSSTALLEYYGEEAASEWSAWSSLVCQASMAWSETVNQDTAAALEVWFQRVHCTRSDLSGWASSWAQAKRSYSSTVQIEHLIEHMLLWLRDEGVVLPHPDSVTNFARKHDDMSVATEIMATTCRGRFGKDARLVLDVYRDPEQGSDQYLFLCVRTHDYNSDFTRLIDEVGVLGDALRGSNTGLLLVSTDFAPIE
jgi:hypothetical protein